MSLSKSVLPKESTDRAAKKLYTYMRLRQSAEDGVKAQETFPGLSLPETQSRLSRRHLQKLHRASDPTTVKCWQGLRQVYDEVLLKSESPQAALRALVATWGVWRLGGNSRAWFDVVGSFKDWDFEAKYRLRDLWLQGLKKLSLGRAWFYDGLKPTEYMHNSAGKWHTHRHMLNDVCKKMEQIIAQIDCLAQAHLKCLTTNIGQMLYVFQGAFLHPKGPL